MRSPQVYNTESQYHATEVRCPYLFDRFVCAKEVPDGKQL